MKKIQKLLQFITKKKIRKHPLVITKKKVRKLSFYVLRWQLSTPILYLVMACVKLPELDKVILANFIGALVFFPVDELIFKNRE